VTEAYLATARKVRVTVNVAGAERGLLSILERESSGDLIIGFAFGGKFIYGANNSDILHEKYSIHVSPNSAEFTTLKYTLSLSNGDKTTTCALTDAVKMNSGFYGVFTAKSSDLADDRYLIPANDKAERIIIPSFPLNFALLYSVLVGNCDALFGPHPGLSIADVKFTNFKIVILAQYIALPAHRLGNKLHSLTYPPSLADDPILQSQFREVMRGRDASHCVRAFRECSNILAEQHVLQLIDAFAGTEEIPYLESRLSEIRSLRGSSGIEVIQS